VVNASVVGYVEFITPDWVILVMTPTNLGKEPSTLNITEKGLWEILVPTKRNDGRPFHTRYHRIWDSRVRAISGGLTLLPVVKGQWESGGVLYHNERMIPVRIIATREEIEKIIDMSIIYYEQEAVLAYRVADEVILKNKSELSKKKKKTGDPLCKACRGDGRDHGDDMRDPGKGHCPECRGTGEGKYD
jgi:hypothetical protein